MGDGDLVNMKTNYLYECLSSDGAEIPMGYSLKVFTPSIALPLLSLKNKSGFANDYHNLWVEVRWAAASLLKYQIYYLEKDGEIVHTSYVSSKSFKFPFMKKGDYHIGPCHTVDSERGKGLYPIVLKNICKEKKTENNHIYMIVEDSNKSSHFGVLKAGFERKCKLKKTRVLKKYYKEDDK